MSSLRAWLIAVLVALGLAATAVPAGAHGVRGEQASRLRWRECAGSSGAQCARLTVPLDDTNPDDHRTIDLTLTRVQARDPERRIGALLVNPGGPGVPGSGFAPEIAGALPEEIQDRFDIVGWDPRGTGRNGIGCNSKLDSWYALDWDPDTDAERRALEAANRAYVDSCVRAAGDLLPFVSSDRTARDMDRIRAALGEDGLTYLGFSYGTYLGAQYAAQFPERVRALVLDGAVDPALDATAAQVEQAVGFEHSLDLFFEDCAATSSCAFHGGDAPAAAYDRLRARVDDDPIGAADSRGLNGTLFDIGVAQLLYEGEESWSTLADALAAAEDGDGSDLVAYADLYTGRDDNGRYDDVQGSFTAIGCADGPPMGDVAAVREIEAKAEQAAPRLGRSIVNNSLACAFWPVQAPPPAPLAAPGSAPILVLGTRNDPATPVAWARGLAKELGPARLVTVGGARHTAFASGNGCVDRVVERYLVELAVPRSGKRC